MTVLALDFGDAVATSAIAAFFTVLIGGVVTYRWTGAKRRQEDQLAALARFHDLYGDWCNGWQEWTHACATCHMDDAELKRGFDEPRSSRAGLRRCW